MKRLKAKKQLPIIALVILSAAFGVAGCGGGDSEDEDTQPKAQYIKQADEICNKTEARQTALVKQITNEPPIKDQDKAFIHTVEVAGIPPLQEQVEELEGLDSPDQGAGDAEAFLTEFKKALGEVEKDPASINEPPDPFEEAEKLAKDFGFKVCGGA